VGAPNTATQLSETLGFVGAVSFQASNLNDLLVQLWSSLFFVFCFGSVIFFTQVPPPFSLSNELKRHTQFMEYLCH
jgi:hypothetical protein